MKYTEARPGRIFILRLEQGDRLPEVVESFARERGIGSALVFFLGGAQGGSKVITGPGDGNATRPVPMLTELRGVSEAVGVGTLFTDQQGGPRLHLHASFGRNRDTVVGCTREGVKIWQIGEVILLELTGSSAVRRVNPENGFEMLEVVNRGTE